MGVTPTVLKNAVLTAVKTKNDFPPIFTLNHLAQMCRSPYRSLRIAVDRTNDYDSYRVFKLKKRNAGFSGDRFRFVCAPFPDLLRAQRWINKHILSKALVHSSSLAYGKGHGVLHAAAEHCGAKWLIKLDVTNFFESILEPDVYKLFRSFGYQPLVSFELARICTRVRKSGNLTKPKLLTNGMPYRGRRIGHLPQGAATSPLISNLVMAPLDERLLNFALGRNLKYTRYADDLVFSSDEPFVRENAVQYITELYGVLRSYGMWPNKAKTKIVSPGARKIVLGLLVDGEVPRLTKEYRKYVSDHLYFLSHPQIDQYSHAIHKGFDSVPGLKNHLNGKIAYAYSIDEDWALKMWSIFNKIPPVGE